MSFGYQPPPPKTTDTGTIVGYLALVFIGIPILLCIVGGLALWGLASAGSGKFGGKAAAWQKVVAEKQRMEQELIAELKTIAAANNNSIPITSVNHISTRGLEIDRKLNELANATHREWGEAPQAVKDELKSTAELEKFVSTLNRNSSPLGNWQPSSIPSMPSMPSGSPSMPSGQSLAERMAQQRAESEQRMAALRAEQQQRETERRQREEQEAAQRVADQLAREQRLREFANNVPQPQPINPQPGFNPPGVNNSPAQPPANQPPPGYEVTDVSQLKLKDSVFVLANGQWHPAFVQLKRGKLIQVRSTETGAVEVVTIDRLRVQNEPTAKPGGNLPPAMQVAKAPNKPGNNQEEEDDALFVAKPPGEQAAIAPEPAAVPASTPVTPAKPAATVAEYRTWTNDTGEFKVEAELVNFEFDLVTLRRRDGKVLSLRIEKLSTADQAVIREKFP